MRIYRKLKKYTVGTIFKSKKLLSYYVSWFNLHYEIVRYPYLIEKLSKFPKLSSNGGIWIQIQPCLWLKKTSMLHQAVSRILVSNKQKDSKQGREIGCET